MEHRGYVVLPPRQKDEVITITLLTETPWLDETIALLCSPAGDEVLAFYAATLCITHGPLPEGLRIPFERIRQCISVSPYLSVRVRCLRRRMREIAEVSDPAAEFARLAGAAGLCQGER